MSITLNAAQINSLVVAGVTIETDGVAAVTGIQVDYIASTITFQITMGSLVGSAPPVFVPGQIILGNLVAVFNTITGNWYVNGSPLTGTLTGTPLATIQANMRTYRNNAEAFANSLGVVPGTIVTW